MSNFLQITPFMHCEDLAAALHFFENILGFVTPFKTWDYAYVEREGCGIRIWAQSGKDAPPPGTRRFMYYIDVRDVDSLFAELKPKLDTLPAGDVYGPVNQTWKQREFMVLAPDGNLIVFGQAIQATASQA